MTEPDRSLQVRWPTLGAVFLAVGTVSAVLLRWRTSRGGELPTIPLLLAVLLLLVAAVVLVLGLRVRAWIRRGEPIDALGAARTLVLGQTAALAGAVLMGYLTASLALAALQLQAPEPRAVAIGSAVSLIAAAAMTVTGMVAQWCCQVPPEDEDRDDGGPAASA